MPSTVVKDLAREHIFHDGKTLKWQCKLGDMNEKCLSHEKNYRVGGF